MLRGQILLVLLALMQPVFAQQMNCDCTQIVGSCDASIRVKPTGGPGSYGGELSFTSTAPICSKISYYVDSTPYFNILSQGNRDQDSVFGTSPITQASVSDVKCQVCKSMKDAAARSDDAKTQKAPDLAGRWVQVEARKVAV